MIKTLSIRIEKLTKQLAAEQDKNKKLLGALKSLQAILCDSKGNVCIGGSDGDRRIAQEAFKALKQSN